MGNRQGNRKDDSKNKVDKKSEKEAQKARKKAEKNEKKDKRKGLLGHKITELDTDVEESSHMTGGDSESCVFHSAENVSSSPYLDASSRHDQEAGSTWSGTFQHPNVLSSSDFQDGFSLEACLPPEIARPETYSNTYSSSRSQQRHNTTNLSSNTGSQLERIDVKPSSGVSLSPGVSKHDHFNQAATVSLVGGAEKPLNLIPSRFNNLQEPSIAEFQRNIPPSPGSGNHHPHFYNHHQDRQHHYRDLHNLPKPSSPQPQRRALSLKMVTPPYKPVSSENTSPAPSSSSPSPLPYRPGANFLALFRPSSKRGKEARYTTDKSSEPVSEEILKTSDSSTSDETKAKSKQIWKTWERPRNQKFKKQKVSIFGTSRKSSSKETKNNASENTTKAAKKENQQLTEPETTTEKALCFETHKTVNIQSDFNNVNQKTNKDSLISRTSIETSSNDSNETIENEEEIVSDSSPPLSKTAAFCILKLEELERSIEKTIREKFPDAEPFLLRKRSKEELRGSRSLPTTPSLKKKLYVARGQDENVINSRPGDDKGVARVFDETYESLPSPTKSPLILRRFGTRTRHASISPKIQRAKTATLFNSPSEISNVDGSYITTEQTSAKVLPSKLSSAQKSESKYDNVMDPNDCLPPVSSEYNSCPFHQGHVKENSKEISNDPVTNDDDSAETDNVINPTFSAVFGSVSPKLKRHLQVKFNEMQNGTEENKVQTSANVGLQQKLNKIPSKESQQQEKDLALIQELKEKMVMPGNQGVTKQIDKGIIALKSLEHHNQKRVEEKADKDKRVAEDELKGAKSINKTVPCESLTSCQPLDDNTEHVGKFIQHTTGRVGNGTEKDEEGRLISSAIRKFSAGAETVSSAAKPQERITAKKPGQLASGSAIRHSKDHVMVRPESPEHAQSRNVNITHLKSVVPHTTYLEGTVPHYTHLESTVLHTTHIEITVPQTTHLESTVPQKFICTNRQHASESQNLQCVSSPLVSSVPDAPLTCDVSQTNVSVIKITESVSVKRDESSAVSCIDGAAETRTGYAESSTAVNQSKQTDKGTLESQIESCKRVRRRKKNVLTDQQVVSGFTDSGVSSQKLDYQKLQQQHEKHLQDDESASVLKQPVSQVISQMISLSKRQPHTVDAPIQEQEKPFRLQEPNKQQKDIHLQQPSQRQQEQHLKQQDTHIKQHKASTQKQEPHKQQKELSIRPHGPHIQQSDPSIRQHGPHIQQREFIVQQQDFQIQQQVPFIRQQDHSIQQQVPSIQQQRPFIRQQGPSIRQQDHNIKQQVLSNRQQGFSTQSPSIQLQSPSIRQQDPDTQQTNSSIHQMAPHRQKAGQLPQPSLTPNDYDSVQTKSAVAIVTLPNNHQSYHTLEDNTVISIPYTAGDTTQETNNSRCQEIQTDSITTADKSVDSDGLAESYQTSLPYKTRALNASKKHKKCIEEKEKTGTEDSDDATFMKMVQAGRTTRIKTADEKDVRTEQVPPCSPTAMNQLMEKFDEGDDDEDNEEIRMGVREEGEMKQFTEIIYKRLSDLLGSQSKDENIIGEDNDEVFVEDKEEINFESEIEEDYNKREAHEDSPCENRENSSPTRVNTRASALTKVLTIETSSSLTTTTSSESDIDDDTPMLFQAYEPGHHDEYQKKQEDVTRESKKKHFGFLDSETGRTGKSNDGAQTSGSRVYHSDDDVATGRGIPDYYDDRPLWSRRQKNPGQLSAAMMAIRWRERRERWLKKRKRNRTDLLSTGSSDTGSERCLFFQTQTDSNYFLEDEDDNRSTQRKDMGSGILTSPKYSKPILPFLGGIQTECPSEGARDKSFPDRLHSSNQHKRHESKIHASSRVKHRPGTRHEGNKDKRQDEEHRTQAHIHGHTPEVTNTDVNVPSIEDTFQELISVQNILVEMQDRKADPEDSCDKNYLPLTTENVKSIRDYYKDFYSSGNGRRSRMSATDRTESDLDLYSEMPDDASSDSQVYADDEGDDDGLEPYATAEDDAGTAGRDSSTSRSSKCGGARTGVGDEDDDQSPSVVLSCTFYNSNTHPDKVSDPPEADIDIISATDVKITQRTSSGAQTLTSTGLNSDEEFWTGSTVMDESYKQLEAAANAVSSTFQNARDQMHDIQYHLQALRRQMEVMQDDLTCISTNLPTTTEYLEK